QSRYGKKGKDEEGKYVEVEQFIGSGTPVGETSGLKEGILKSSILEIESIAKSLGAVDISKKGMGGGSNVKEPSIKRKKWTRRKGVGRRTQTNQRILNAKNRWDSCGMEMLSMGITIFKLYRGWVIISRSIDSVG
ncbi:hypothetical protein RYX36_035478, partial [Vicia faba]